MGYELRRWFADNLPAGLSSGERLVALEIADQANDKTRLAYGRDLLDIVTRRTGFANAKQVRKVLTKLAVGGVELRVVIGKDKNGDPVYAYEGHQTTYRIPTPVELGCKEGPQRGPLSQEDPRLVPSGPPDGDERAPAEGQEGPPAGVPSPHVPSNPSPHLISSETRGRGEDDFSKFKDEPLPQRLFFDLGATRNEAEMLTYLKTKKHEPKSAAWWRTVYENGDMADWLERYRRNMAEDDDEDEYGDRQT